MKRLFAVAAAVIASLVVVVTSASPAYAATTSSGLSITPRKNYTLESGRTITDKLTIGNLNRDVPLFINLRTIDFSFSDETGTPKLMIDQGSPQTTWSVKPFIKLPTDILEIPAGTSKTIDYTVNVPAKQGAGSFYGAIQYVSGASEGGNVNLSASGVTLIFLNIPGAVKEDMKLQKFGLFQRDSENGITGKYLSISVDKSPEVVAFSLKNEGNVAESPAGTITIKDMFGRKMTTLDNANPNSNLALIGQTRRFEACLSPAVKKVDLGGTAGQTVTCNPTKWMPGRYTASMDLYYGQNGNQTKEITAVSSFWYLPIWFLLVILAVIFVIGYIVWRVKRKLSGRTAKSGPGRIKLGRRN